MSQATNKLGGHVPSVTDIPSLMAYEASQGMSYIIVKAGNGSTNFPSAGNSQFTVALVNAAHDAGLKIFAYTRSHGVNIQGEINLATSCFNKGADGFVLDAEAEWEASRMGTTGPSKAIQLCSGIKSLWPTKFLAHSPFPVISYHSSFPYKEFGYYCDAVMPQVYWYSLGRTPTSAIDWMDTEWRNWHNSLSVDWVNSIKPIAPIGQADTVNIPGGEISEFFNYLRTDPNCASAGGYKGCSFWRADLHTVEQWDAIGVETIGDPPGPPSYIVIDNPGAKAFGSWSTGSGATDKYGINYRYKGQGTGTAYFQFTPHISYVGTYDVYEWHPQGGNRSPGVPHIINSAWGTTTVYVDQTVNGGTWNWLGNFYFDAGNSGNVQISDGFAEAGKLAMSDAMLFVWVPPPPPDPPPADPTDLAAYGVWYDQIDLYWTDNAWNEEYYVVSRSESPGGPYVDIAWLGPDSTFFSDTGLASGTTYYYVVYAVNYVGYSNYSNEAWATTYW